MIRISDLDIPAADGRFLAASVFAPQGETPAATVVINAATGVRRRYYNAYATFLAEQGLQVVTFDYRGIGDSRRRDLRDAGPTMRDWAEQDIDGVIAWIGASYPDSRLLVVGHSFGGQALGMLAYGDRVDAAVLVASQSGYWGHWPAHLKPGLFLLWYFVMPVASRLLGYFPARRLGMGENLPAGVARQWARWCRHRDYLLRDGGERWRRAFARLDLPILAYSFSDDRFAPRRAVDALLGCYASAAVEQRHLRPAELGVKSIGHFGFFRERFRDSLWRDSARWLQAWANTGHRPVPARPSRRA